MIVDKHEDVMAKFGAILAQGIIDAGGRNVSVSLQSRTGHTNMLAVVGVLVFTQYWYWFPLAHCLALAFSPTCLIALNAQLKMPKMDIRSNGKPVLYAYPPPLEEKKREEREKVTTAVLSIAARARRRENERRSRAQDKNKEADKDDEAMDVDEPAPSKKEDKKPVLVGGASSSKTAAAASRVRIEITNEDGLKRELCRFGLEPCATSRIITDPDKDVDEKAKKEEEKKEETWEMLSNPARVVKPQLRVLSMPEGSAYAPLKDLKIGGIVMVRRPHDDGHPAEELVEPVAAFGPKPDEDKEPEPPEAFEYTED